MKKIIKINEEQLNNLVKTAVTRVLEENRDESTFEENANLGDLIMKLYQFGVDLNTNKDFQINNPQMIGSIIMESCRKMMEIYKNKGMADEFKSEFSKRSKK